MLFPGQSNLAVVLARLDLPCSESRLPPERTPDCRLYCKHRVRVPLSVLHPTAGKGSAIGGQRCCLL